MICIIEYPIDVWQIHPYIQPKGKESLPFHQQLVLFGRNGTRKETSRISIDFYNFLPFGIPIVARTLVFQRGSALRCSRYQVYKTPQFLRAENLMLYDLVVQRY